MGCDSFIWTVNGKLYSCYIYTNEYNIHLKKEKKKSMILIQEISVLLQEK